MYSSKYSLNWSCLLWGIMTFCFFGSIVKCTTSNKNVINGRSHELEVVHPSADHLKEKNLRIFLTSLRSDHCLLQVRSYGNEYSTFTRLDFFPSSRGSSHLTLLKLLLFQETDFHEQNCHGANFVMFVHEIGLFKLTRKSMAL